MFDAPEYASYIALCRELRLERGTVAGTRVDGWEEGDWYLLDGAPYLFSAADEDEWSRQRYEEFREAIWLPRLDQWLAMLEEAGATSLYWQRLPSNGWYRVYLDPEVRNAGPHGPQPDADLMSGGPAREEAAARLWKVLAEREVASG